jgi:hypothetical protein
MQAMRHGIAIERAGEGGMHMRHITGEPRHVDKRNNAGGWEGPWWANRRTTIDGEGEGPPDRGGCPRGGADADAGRNRMRPVGVEAEFGPGAAG